jgi:hypothetical protein
MVVLGAMGEIVREMVEATTDSDQEEAVVDRTETAISAADKSTLDFTVA